MEDKEAIMLALLEALESGGTGKAISDADRSRL